MYPLAPSTSIFIAPSLSGSPKPACGRPALGSMREIRSEFSDGSRDASNGDGRPAEDGIATHVKVGRRNQRFGAPEPIGGGRRGKVSRARVRSPLFNLSLRLFL